MNRCKSGLILAAVMLACSIGVNEADAKSQMCPVDGGPCIGGGPAPIPPRIKRVLPTLADFEHLTCEILRSWRFRCSIR